jgi:hypothetical protein
MSSFTDSADSSSYGCTAQFVPWPPYTSSSIISYFSQLSSSSLFLRDVLHQLAVHPPIGLLAFPPCLHSFIWIRCSSIRVTWPAHCSRLNLVTSHISSSLHSSCSELSSGMYCRVKWLSTDVSEVRTASIIIPEDNSEHHTRRRENLKSHNDKNVRLSMWKAAFRVLG